jgi:hypothetical protein
MLDLLRRLLASMRHETDRRLMDRQRLSWCDHDYSVECDACYFDRFAATW